MVEDVLTSVSELAAEPVPEVVRLFLYTPFSDYTVTEGLLLLLLLMGFVMILIWFFRGRF